MQISRFEIGAKGLNKLADFCVVMGAGLVPARCRPACAPPAKVPICRYVLRTVTYLIFPIVFLFSWCRAVGQCQVSLLQRPGLAVVLGPIFPLPLGAVLAAAPGACCGAWPCFPTPFGTCACCGAWGLLRHLVLGPHALMLRKFWDPFWVNTSHAEKTTDTGQ